MKKVLIIKVGYSEFLEEDILEKTKDFIKQLSSTR